MALKGSILKKEITDKILATFEGSFLYNDGKEIRIPGVEDGQELQVKVALTCAKTPVTPDGENALPGEDIVASTSVASVSTVMAETTQEEKDNIRKMMEVLGL